MGGREGGREGGSESARRRFASAFRVGVSGKNERAVSHGRDSIETDRNRSKPIECLGLETNVSKFHTLLARTVASFPPTFRLFERPSILAGSVRPNRSARYVIDAYRARVRALHADQLVPESRRAR